MPIAIPLSLDFNPRTPTGCDSPLTHVVVDNIHFNPRTPTGCDLASCDNKAYRIRFQSTHPYGMRRELLWTPCSTCSISIHAPLRDATSLHPTASPPPIISIHAPLRDATRSGNCKVGRHVISIHAPLRDATEVRGRDRHCRRISIHAPLRDATKSSFLHIWHRSNFNPRTPTGCDVNIGEWDYQYEISIHAPLRDATFLPRWCGICISLFQSTHPYGMRHRNPSRCSSSSGFQSTHPYGMRLRFLTQFSVNAPSLRSKTA